MLLWEAVEQVRAACCLGDVLLARRLSSPPTQPMPSLPPPPNLLLRSGGFFEGDDDFCQALVDGGCVKALQLQLCRDVEGAQFVEALEEALAPRMRLMGGASLVLCRAGVGWPCCQCWRERRALLPHLLLPAHCGGHGD